MTPSQISQAITAGFKNALCFSERVLGIESSEREIPVVKPEYVLTVALADALSGADWRVSLERSWQALFEKTIVDSSIKLVLSKKIPMSERGSFVERLINQYRWGRTRADIVVSNPDGNPLLICEVKLDMSLHSLILKDVKRIARFLAAYSTLSAGPVYGAVIFCVMRRVLNGAAQPEETLERSFAKLMAKLDLIRPAYPQVHISAGILEDGFVSRDPQTYYEEDDAGPYTAGERDGYIFAPYIVFLGTNSDTPTYRAARVKAP